MDTHSEAHENGVVEEKTLTLSESIVEVFRHGTATMGDLVETTKGKGFGFLLVVFSVPNALPLPPGASTPFGIILIFLTVQMVLGRKTPWFPKWVMERKLGGTSGKFLLKMSTMISRVEKYLKPRHSWVYKPALMRAFFGPLMVIAAICVSLPISGFGTNSIPSLGLGMIGVGMLEEDGVVGLVGVVGLLAGIMIVVTLVVLVVLGIRTVTS